VTGIQNEGLPGHARHQTNCRALPSEWTWSPKFRSMTAYARQPWPKATMVRATDGQGKYHVRMGLRHGLARRWAPPGDRLVGPQRQSANQPGDWPFLQSALAIWARHPCQADFLLGCPRPTADFPMRSRVTKIVAVANGWTWAVNDSVSRAKTRHPKKGTRFKACLLITRINNGCGPSSARAWFSLAYPKSGDFG